MRRALATVESKFEKVLAIVNKHRAPDETMTSLNDRALQICKTSNGAEA
jgi:hypothetical protein